MNFLNDDQCCSPKLEIYFINPTISVIEGVNTLCFDRIELPSYRIYKKAYCVPLSNQSNDIDLSAYATLIYTNEQITNLQNSINNIENNNSWVDIINKPFNTIGTGLSVESGVLSANSDNSAHVQAILAIKDNIDINNILSNYQETDYKQNSYILLTNQNNQEENGLYFWDYNNDSYILRRDNYFWDDYKNTLISVTNGYNAGKIYIPVNQDDETYTLSYIEISAGSGEGDYIPLSGTEIDKPFTGTIEFTNDTLFKRDDEIIALVDYGVRIGSAAGYGATNASNSNFLGRYAGSGATYASHSNFLGWDAGYGATSASNSNFLGGAAGYGATNASGSNFLGDYAGSGATDASHSNFLGGAAGYGATNASGSNFLGSAAGSGATNASHSNFLGWDAGSGATSASYSNFLGYNVGNGHTESANPGHVITGSNNILIGTNITTPLPEISNMFSFGNVLYGFNTHDTTTGTPSFSAQRTGKISVGTNTPAESAILDLTSTTMGFLLPRMTGINAENIANKAEGLMIYSTNGNGETITNKGWWGWDGSTYIKLNNSGGVNSLTTNNNIGTATYTGGILNIPNYVKYGGNNTAGNYGLVIGETTTLASLTGANTNMVIGTNALNALISGDYNFALGGSAMSRMTTGTGNLAIGPAVLGYNLDGSNNLVLGYGSGKMPHGSRNTILGTDAMGNAATTGSQILDENILIGYQAGRQMSLGNRNIIMGITAAYNNTGNDNILIGKEVGYNNTADNLLIIDNQNRATPYIKGDMSALTLNINADTTLKGLKIATDAAVGKVLTSDATGVATWQTNNALKKDGDFNVHGTYYLDGTLGFLRADNSAGLTVSSEIVSALAGDENYSTNYSTRPHGVETHIMYDGDTKETLYEAMIDGIDLSFSEETDSYGIRSNKYHGNNYTDNSFVQKLYVDNAIAASTPTLDKRRVIALAEDFTTTSTSYVAVTSLEASVVEGKTYRFKINASVTTSSMPNGAGVGITGPSSSYISYFYTRAGSGNSVTTPYNGWLQTVTTSSLPFVSGNLLIIEGSFKAGATGTVSVQFASETNAGATLNPGTYLEIEEIL